MSLTFRYKFYILLLACAGGMISACGKAVPTTEPAPTTVPSPSAVATQVPTLTPTPTALPGFAVLLATSAANQEYVHSLQSSLNDIVVGAGLRWEIRQNLSKDDLTPALRLVVALPPDPGVTQLAAMAPETQFLAVGIPALSKAPNLTIIGSESSRPDQEGFIAGVIAAMLSADWRVGVISQSDSLEGRAARTGFLSGVEYFCGLCRPLHPPFYEYPLYVELPSTASTAEWQEAANYMVDHEVLTVYVHSGPGAETIFSVLAAAKVNIIGSGEPPQAALSSWAVSLVSEPLLLIQTQVKGLLDGSLSGGQTLNVPLQFTQINPAVFTPGKQRLAEQTLTDLQNGLIGTGVDLTTGEFSP